MLEIYSSKQTQQVVSENPIFFRVVPQQKKGAQGLSSVAGVQGVRQSQDNKKCGL